MRPRGTLALQGGEGVSSLEKYKISSIIKCLIERGYDKITAHSMAFLILLAKGNKDFSDFRPTDEGVMYTSYVESQCNNFIPPSVNYSSEVIRSLAKKMWKIIVGDSADFNEEELKLVDELGIIIYEKV